MICDSHIHIGKFEGNLEFEPKFVAQTLIANGVDKWLYFSTASNAEDFDENVYIDDFYNKMNTMYDVAGERAIPALWLSFKMFSTYEKYISSDFKALKFHIGVEDKYLSDIAIDMVFSVAQKVKLPLIIHTGDDEFCSCNRFLNLAKKHKKLKIILAHGRPLNGAINALKECRNIFIDTAFMPVEYAKILVSEGFLDRLIFGTDFPVQKYFYPNIAIESQYLNTLTSYKKEFPEDFFCKNFQTLFL